MELFESKNHFIFLKGNSALFCDRLTGNLRVGKADELVGEWNPICLGRVQGVIGKLRYYPDSEWRLLVIRSSQLMGRLPDDSEVYRITRICILPLTTAPLANLDLELCNLHHFGIKKTEKIVQTPDTNKPFIKAFQQHFKSAAENVKPRKILMFTKSSETPSEVYTREVREREKFERRIQEEVLKLFQEEETFYFSPDGDLLTNLQKQHLPNYDKSLAPWRRGDERFFWNKCLLEDVISSENKPSGHGADPVDVDAFVVPLMMGFVQIETAQFLPLSTPQSQLVPGEVPPQEDSDRPSTELVVSLISRRNKYRAGTRFRRRGVDKDANVANYVETEQILKVSTEKSPHTVSFVQVRGSVPVFWSQSGFKYRPPIKLEKGTEENQVAFKKHIERDLSHTDRLIVVSLVDTGLERQEKKISDSYLKHLILMNDPRLTCVLFDFHDYCRGMHFENVSILLKGLAYLFRDMKYTWVDSKGIICEQRSLFRVNCVDCLDRTNVVQCMIAGVVLETQLRKLGLLYPEDHMPSSFHRKIQEMWANNGDAISQQYAGTIAMKGDYTRTGERTMNGLMRDGMSSMNRYYLRFRDITRQATLDLLLLEENSPDLKMLRNGANDDLAVILKQKEENIKLLTTQCKRLCLDFTEDNLAESILISCNENEKELNDMNTVVLITNVNLYFISRIDILPPKTDITDSSKPVCLRVPLQNLQKIELGLEPAMFRSKNYAMRVHFTDMSLNPGYFLTFRQPSLRLFNNLLVPVKTADDMMESLVAVSSGLVAAASAAGYEVPMENIGKLERMRSKAMPVEYMSAIESEEFYAVCAHHRAARVSLAASVSAQSLLLPGRSSGRQRTSRVTSDRAALHLTTPTDGPDDLSVSDGVPISLNDPKDETGAVESFKNKFMSIKVNFSGLRSSLGFRPDSGISESSRPGSQHLALPSQGGSRDVSPSPSQVSREESDEDYDSSENEDYNMLAQMMNKESQEDIGSEDNKSQNSLTLDDDQPILRTIPSLTTRISNAPKIPCQPQKASSPDTSTSRTDELLDSCGIVLTTRSQQKQLAESSEVGAALTTVVASLASAPDREAVIQRRIERLSRHLSQDEFNNTSLPNRGSPGPVLINQASLDRYPAVTSSPFKIQATILETAQEGGSAHDELDSTAKTKNNANVDEEDVFHDNDLSLEIALASPLHVGPHPPLRHSAFQSRSMKLSFSETALSARDTLPGSAEGHLDDVITPSEMTESTLAINGGLTGGNHNADMTDSTSLTVPNAQALSGSLAWIRLPPIELHNQKFTDRMIKKQLDQALEVESMRKVYLGNDDLQVEMVIF